MNASDCIHNCPFLKMTKHRGMRVNYNQYRCHSDKVPEKRPRIDLVPGQPIQRLEVCPEGFLDQIA